MVGAQAVHRILSRMKTPSLFRMVALVLVTILVITFATPAKADADVMTTITLVSLIIAGVAIIAYLIIANTTGNRGMSSRVLRIACLGDDCRELLARLPSPSLAPVPVQLETP